MPVDTSMYNTKAPENPLTMAGNAVSLASGIQQNQLYKQENKLVRAKLGLGQILQQHTDANGQTDWNGFVAEAANNPLTQPVADIAIHMRDNALTPTSYTDASGTTQYRTAQGRQQELTGTPPNEATLPQDKLDELHEKTDAFDKELAPLLSNPNLKRKDVTDGITNLMANGHVDPHHAVAMVTKLPEDPNQLRSLLQKQKQEVGAVRNHLNQNYGVHSSALRPPSNTSGPAPGVAEAATAKLGKSTKNYQDIQDQATAAPQTAAVMGQIADLSKNGAPTGTGVSKIYQYLSEKGLVDPASTPEKQREEIGKYMEQAALAAGMPTSDARLSSLHKSNVNPDLLPSAIQGLVPFFQAVAKGSLLKQNYYNKQTGNGADLRNEPVTKQKLDNNYDPRLIELQSLPPEERADYVKTHPSVKALLPKYQQLKKMGFFGG